MLGNVLMGFRGLQKVERNEREEEQISQGFHGLLLVLYYNQWTDQPSDSEEKVDHLDPVVLVVANKQLENAEVT